MTQLQLLAEVAYHTANNSGLQTALSYALDAAVVVMRASTARLVLRRNGDTAISAVGLEADALRVTDARIHDYCQAEGRLQVPNVLTSPARLDVAALTGVLASIYAFALVLQGEQQATFWVGFEQPTILSDNQREFLNLLAFQIAVAINMDYLNEAARTGKEQLTALLANDIEPIVIVDKHYQIRVFNPAAEVLFHSRAADALGKPFDAVVEHQALRDILRAGVDGPRDVEFTSENRRTFSPHVSEVRGEDGTLKGWLLVLREVTRFKRLSENMGDFLHTVSHDIRSPMTAAKGFVDMLSMIGPVNDRQKSFIDKIQRSISDMTNLVEKVLDAGRLDPEMDAYEIRREPCDPAAIVTKVVSTLTPAAAEKKITLTAEVSSDLPIMNMDELMVERALLNLVENAIKYTPEGGQVWVQGKVEDNNLVLAVKDNGLGIAPQDQARLFERGERVRRQEHKGIRGSGLGLFIVRNVARKHNGVAVVESEPDQGSKFSISIPLSGKNLVSGGG